MYDRPWDDLLTATAGVAASLVTATMVGVAQARRMTRLRRSALRGPDDAVLAKQVRSGAPNAAVLRASIGALSLILIVLGVLLAS